MADRQQTKLPSIGSAPAVAGPDQHQEKTRDAGAVAGAGKRSLPVPDAASVSLLPGPLVEPLTPGAANTDLLQPPQQALRPSPPALGTATTSPRPGPKSHSLTPGVINGDPLQARSQGLVNQGAAVPTAPSTSKAPPAWSQGRVPPGAAAPTAPSTSTVPPLGADLFAQHTSPDGHRGRDLYPGDVVTFTRHKGAKGLYALHVHRLTEEELRYRPDTYYQYEESQEDPDGSEDYPQERAQRGHSY